MTRLHNDPTAFVDEMVEGLVAAYGRWVRPVRGGVVRRQRPSRPKVAVVIGGGSGHYPAFGGLVGPGLADGAVMGNVFASPSSSQVMSVVESAESGAGVLLSYGNYAGDVLNFDLAQQKLQANGISCRTVVVTDDVASAIAAESHLRRGVAGDLVVFKVAGAAAEEGRPLDEVAAIAERANRQTRSLGVAFSGCTLPGATQPLFEVPTGSMAIGMGIHGEPGLTQTDMVSANELAGLLVDALLAERGAASPSVGSSRVAVLVNGLGAVKVEELLVLYREISRLLHSAGIDPVDPEVGELVTSFDMAGLSLTLTWLDDELEALWRAPANTAGFRRTAPDGDAGTDVDVEVEVEVDESGSAGDTEHLTAARSDSALAVVAALVAMRVTLDSHVDELGRLDAVAGDGDHGIGMQRGARVAALAAEGAWQRGAGPRTTLRRAADAWADRAGGASGALWGVILHAVADELSEAEPPSAAELLKGIRSAIAGVQAAGNAQPGDKTMLDAMWPFAEAFDRELAKRDDLLQAWTAATAAAVAGADQTSSMVPRIGRARSHATHALGTPDPGATSFVLISQAILALLADSSEPKATGED